MRKSTRVRTVTLSLLLALVALSHWITPTDGPYVHAVHVVMRKAFMIPVILAAIWFGLRGALCTAAAVTILYLPHVAYQWRSAWAENLNQLAEVAGVWLVAVTAGLLVVRVGIARRSALEPYSGRLGALIAALEAQLTTLDSRERTAREKNDRQQAA